MGDGVSDEPNLGAGRFLVELGIRLEESWWAWYWYLDEKTSDWNRLVPELEKECHQEGGKLLPALADRFVAIALAAVPEVDAWLVAES